MCKTLFPEQASANDYLAMKQYKKRRLKLGLRYGRF